MNAAIMGADKTGSQSFAFSVINSISERSSYEIINQASERRIQNNRLRRKRELHKNFLLTILTICFTITFAFSVNVILSDAKDTDKPIYYKYYSSVVVEKGDTLWSIAEEHMGTQYESTADYVKEVMQMNSLTNDHIIAGQHLVIPYYSTEFMN